MFSTLELNTELSRLRQQELREMAKKLRSETSNSGSPVLAALGRQLVNLGERLQHTAQVQDQPAFELQTKQA